MQVSLYEDCGVCDTSAACVCVCFVYQIPDSVRLCVHCTMFVCCALYIVYLCARVWPCGCHTVAAVTNGVLVQSRLGAVLNAARESEGGFSIFLLPMQESLSFMYFIGGLMKFFTFNSLGWMDKWSNTTVWAWLDFRPPCAPCPSCPYPEEEEGGMNRQFEKEAILN